MNILQRRINALTDEYEELTYGVVAVEALIARDKEYDFTSIVAITNVRKAWLLKALLIEEEIYTIGQIVKCTSSTKK